MLRKLRAIWHIIIADQFKVYTYRFIKYDPNNEYMQADYASYTYSDETDAVDKYMEHIKKYIMYDK